MDFLDLTEWVEGVITDVVPDVIYTHHSSDLNLDHALTAKSGADGHTPEA